jgi:hypothetical protein
MGISGLLPLLKEVQVKKHVSDFKGKRCVDHLSCGDESRWRIELTSLVDPLLASRFFL